jgi:UDP-glucose 4-epimerase
MAAYLQKGNGNIVMSDNKKILITGGAGFIGSHLAEKLLSEWKEVFVLDNLSTGSLENINHLKENDKFHFTEGSVLDKELVFDLVSKADQVYHLAAAVGVKTVVEKPLESFLINIEGTKNVLDAAVERKVPVLLASTSEVYGKNDSLPFSEEHDRVYGSAYHARWGYGMSKGSDEFLGLAYYREKGLPVVIVRLFNVIGPRQSGAYGMVVPRFIQQALKGEDITVHGSGDQTRCFGYVEDVVGALAALIEAPGALGHIFNLGSDEEISINDLARKIIALTGSKSEIKRIPYAEVYGPEFDDMLHRRPDLSKIKEVIGFKPEYNLEGSLKKIIEYFHDSKK